MTSDEEEVGGDFTVYECPGLAPVGYGRFSNNSRTFVITEATVRTSVFLTVTIATVSSSAQRQDVNCHYVYAEM